MFECAVDGHTSPTMQCTYVMEEMLMAEKHQKHLWVVMRQLQKCLGKQKMKVYTFGQDFFSFANLIHMIFVYCLDLGWSHTLIKVCCFNALIRWILILHSLVLCLYAAEELYTQPAQYDKMADRVFIFCLFMFHSFDSTNQFTQPGMEFVVRAIRMGFKCVDLKRIACSGKKPPSPWSGPLSLTTAL